VKVLIVFFGFSASVEVVGQLSVDGYAVEAGLKLAGTLHTATGTEISIKLLDGQGFDLNIGLPVKESDILTVTTEVLVSVRERGQAQTATALEFQVPRLVRLNTLSAISQP